MTFVGVSFWGWDLGVKRENTERFGNSLGRQVPIFVLGTCRVPEP